MRSWHGYLIVVLFSWSCGGVDEKKLQRFTSINVKIRFYLWRRILFVSQSPPQAPTQTATQAPTQTASLSAALASPAFSSLPIWNYLKDIQQALALQSNLVLQAEPGAGKSTVVPLDLLNAPWLVGDANTPQKIIMLEPRRVAAKSIAHFLAGQLGEKVGGRIGYHVKNDRKVGKDTQLEIVTEGILTRRLQSDPELKGVGLIIFDEFHERSLQADLGLMLALEVQQTL
ncbi:MAG: HrpA-like RNA helicase, partial [Candidatus Endobugula sp.]